MKKPIISFIISISALNAFSQSATILPNSVEIPKVTTLPTCDANAKSRQVYNTSDNKMYYCNGTNWTEMTGGGFSIPYSGTANSSSPLLYLENTGGGRGIGLKTISNSALRAESSNGYGVYSTSNNSYGVYGYSQNGIGIFAESLNDYGLYSYSWSNFSAFLTGKAKVSSKLAVGNIGYADVGAALHIKSSNSNWGQHIRLENYADAGYGEMLHDNDGFKFRNFQPNESFYFRNADNSTVAQINSAGNLTHAGSLTTGGSATVNGNLTTDGSMTVNGGKGVAYNNSSSSNLKIHPFTTPDFTAILGPHAISGEGSFGLPGGFSSPPRVFVGDIDLTGGDAGQLYMVELVVYGCTTSSCKARLINHSAGSVNYSIRWNMVAIGN